MSGKKKPIILPIPILRKEDACAYSTLRWPPLEAWFFIREDTAMLDALENAFQDKTIDIFFSPHSIISIGPLHAAKLNPILSQRALYQVSPRGTHLSTLLLLAPQHQEYKYCYVASGSSQCYCLC